MKFVLASYHEEEGKFLSTTPPFLHFQGDAKKEREDRTHIHVRTGRLGDLAAIRDLKGEMKRNCQIS